MDVAQDAAAEPGEPGGGGTGPEEATEAGGTEEEAARGGGETPADGGAAELPEMVKDVSALSLQDQQSCQCNGDDRPPPDTEADSKESSKKSPKKEPSTGSSLDKELEALLSSITEPAAPDTLMIQSEHDGTVDLVKVEKISGDPVLTEGKAPPPPLRPASTWTSVNIREFKNRMAGEKHGVLTVRRGEVMTVRVPTHPEGKRLCWEFATEDYDIGFGIYFDWTPVTSTAVTIQVSDSSDDEEEEESESPWHSREGDVERGSVYRLRSRYGEIMQVVRRDSHREVQAGSHDYPGEGVYLLKLDNSYSLLRNKTLYFHVYYSS